MLMSRNPEKLLDIKGRKASIMSKSPQKVGEPGDIKENFGHKRRKRRIYVQEAKEAWT